MDATTVRPGPLLKRTPTALLMIGEITRAPRFLSNSCLHAPLFDPGGSAAPRHLGTVDAAFRSENDVGSAVSFLSRLYHAACKPPVYASQPRSLSHHATLGSGRWLTFAGAGLAPASSHRRFRYVDSLLHTILLLQASPGALSAETSEGAFWFSPEGALDLPFTVSMVIPLD